jgi:eukaryotic-like serine/threonine-protein kinase
VPSPSLTQPPSGFELGRVLGPSQTSTVFEVTRGGALFVCKRASPRTVGEGRIEDEARVLRVLAGRGAPRVIEAGSDERGPFLVMEAIAGSPLPVPDLAPHAFEALAAVHEAGVVHGDVSPSNLLANAERAWLIDFGLASLSASETFAGTLAYVAPELARGEAMGKPSDVFAMATTLLHILSGVPPRESRSRAAMLAMAGESTMDAYLARCEPLVSRSILDALAPCLAFDPGGRPPASVIFASHAHRHAGDPRGARG